MKLCWAPTLWMMTAEYMYVADYCHIVVSYAQPGSWVQLRFCLSVGRNKIASHMTEYNSSPTNFVKFYCFGLLNNILH